jgi:hypothetical protein
VDGLQGARQPHEPNFKPPSYANRSVTPAPACSASQRLKRQGRQQLHVCERWLHGHLPGWLKWAALQQVLARGQCPTTIIALSAHTVAIIPDKQYTADYQ